MTREQIASLNRIIANVHNEVIIHIHIDRPVELYKTNVRDLTKFFIREDGVVYASWDGKILEGYTYSVAFLIKHLNNSLPYADSVRYSPERIQKKLS